MQIEACAPPSRKSQACSHARACIAPAPRCACGRAAIGWVRGPYVCAGSAARPRDEAVCWACASSARAGSHGRVAIRAIDAHARPCPELEAPTCSRSSRSIPYLAWITAIGRRRLEKIEDLGDGAQRTLALSPVRLELARALAEAGARVAGALEVVGRAGGVQHVERAELRPWCGARAAWQAAIDLDSERLCLRCLRAAYAAERKRGVR
jgi:hypothetical protein